MALIMGLIMGLLGGPALAWAAQQKGAITAFEKRKTKFSEGKGKNPENDFIGPHRSFAHNALIFGLIFFAMGLFIGSMAG